MSTKSKSLVKFTLVDGYAILLHLNKRNVTSVIYTDFNDLLQDFPLNQYDIKFIECIIPNLQNAYVKCKESSGTNYLRIKSRNKKSPHGLIVSRRIRKIQDSSYSSSERTLPF